MRFPFCVCLISIITVAAIPTAADSGDIAPVIPKPQPAPATQPAQPAKSQPPPTSQPTSRPTLPPEFAVLQTRNIFMHGPPKAGGAPSGPEASFVLKGIVEAEARFTAFIEDKSAKRVASVGVGGAIALGHIKSINLDAIEYEAATGGAARRIEVGRNLMGEVVPPTPPTSKPSAAPPGTGAPGQPGGPPQPGQPGQGRTKGGPQPPQPAEGAPVAAPGGG
jgi:hypothetical protein